MSGQHQPVALAHRSASQEVAVLDLSGARRRVEHDPSFEECPGCGGRGVTPDRIRGVPVNVVCKGCGGKGGWRLAEPAPTAGDGYEVGWP